MGQPPVKCHHCWFLCCGACAINQFSTAKKIQLGNITKGCPQAAIMFVIVYLNECSIFICTWWNNKLFELKFLNWIEFGSKSPIFVPCDLEIWEMTLKNKRAPFLCYFKLSVSFYSHLWIQSGVMVQKTQIGAKFALTSVLLIFDLWSFAWTSLLSMDMVITPENFMMIQWQRHSEKGVTDGWTDGRRDGWKGPLIELIGRS